MKTLKGKALLLLLAAFCFLAIGIFLSTGQDKTGKKSREENEIACFLENTEGVGKAVVRLNLDEDGKITGVAVICDGGNDVKVQSKIIQLLSASLGIGANHIYVTGAG